MENYTIIDNELVEKYTGKILPPIGYGRKDTTKYYTIKEDGFWTPVYKLENATLTKQIMNHLPNLREYTNGIYTIFRTI